MGDWLCSLSGDYVCRAFYPEYLAGWVAAGITLGAAIAALVTLRGLAKQNQIAEESLTDSRRAFALTNRPRLRVRRVVQVSDPNTGATNIEAYVEYSNIGSSVAKVRDLRTALQFMNERTPLPDPQWGTIRAAPAHDVQPGQTVRIDFGTPELDTESFIDFANGTKHFFAVGRIVYGDEINRVREVAFCRKFNHKTRRYDPFDDRDYEYED